MLDPVFAWILRLALAILFSAAALHKLRDLQAFAATVRDYRLLPEVLAGPAAAALVATEALGCAAILAAPLDPIGPLAALLLLGLYTAAIGANLARGRRDIDCGCLGPARRKMLSPRLLGRNAVFATGPLLLLMGALPRALSFVDVISILGGAAVVVLLFASLDELGSSAARSTA